VCPSLSSSTVLTSTAVSVSGPEDIGSSSSSHERGGEWPLVMPSEKSCVWGGLPRVP
jgi:hypothetical protein